MTLTTRTTPESEAFLAKFLTEKAAEKTRRRKASWAAASQRWVTKNPDKNRERQFAWRRNNGARWKEIHRKCTIKRRYGITQEEKRALFAAQGYCCKICKRTDSGWKGDWHTEHCHKTKKIRGVTCQHCNHLIADCNEDITILQAAIEYLREAQKQEG